MMTRFHPAHLSLTKYLFFTGKGGVGKTSVACATALSLADSLISVLIIITDPASNLQDVFSMELSNKGTPIPAVPKLTVANLNPIQAAAEYRESVIAPYRGQLPDTVIADMEEQLSGSCTVEIAAFNEFSHFITDENIYQRYHHIIFDTAPTGHTLRMLKLPSAWSNFIRDSTHGASCLGQLSGLEDKKAIYQEAVATLSDKNQTTLLLVTRPEEAPIKEAGRASQELLSLGVHNQQFIINGMLSEHDDEISNGWYAKQQKALSTLPATLSRLPAYEIPLRPYNITGLNNIRAMLAKNDTGAIPEAGLHTIETAPSACLHTIEAVPSASLHTIPQEASTEMNAQNLSHITDYLYAENKRVIFTMGKGGVGKTTIAAAIALGLAKKGRQVHLTTTDPAAHLNFVLKETAGITMSHIDEQEELKKYQEEVLMNARINGISEADIAYIQEDLRSPCTQEIAVFRAFAQLVEKADEQVVVIDTAPTGHTLLLLESTQSYSHELKRTKGETPDCVKRLLPRLKSDETEVLIVTLPEATPVCEALRLEEDLKRARIPTSWWAVNQSLHPTGTTNEILRAKAHNEVEWIHRIAAHAKGKFALIPWHPEDVKGERLLEL